jgi:hypothetical protein
MDPARSFTKNHAWDFFIGNNIIKDGNKVITGRIGNNMIFGWEPMIWLDCMDMTECNNHGSKFDD